MSTLHMIMNFLFAFFYPFTFFGYSQLYIHEPFINQVMPGIHITASAYDFFLPVLIENFVPYGIVKIKWNTRM